MSEVTLPPQVQAGERALRSPLHWTYSCNSQGQERSWVRDLLSISCSGNCDFLSFYTELKLKKKKKSALYQKSFQLFCFIYLPHPVSSFLSFWSISPSSFSDSHCPLFPRPIMLTEYNLKHVHVKLKITEKALALSCPWYYIATKIKGLH